MACNRELLLQLILSGLQCFCSICTRFVIFPREKRDVEIPLPSVYLDRVSSFGTPKSFVIPIEGPLTILMPSAYA